MLLKTLNTKLTLIVACLALMGCGAHRLERSFFRRPPESRLARLRQYSLEDQYKIFRYGNDVVKPPVLALASPIAERGDQVVPFLLAHLDSEGDDATVRDTIFVFSVMAASKTYDVKSDAALISKLDLAVSRMRDKRWQETCLAMLKRIREST